MMYEHVIGVQGQLFTRARRSSQEYFAPPHYSLSYHACHAFWQIGDVIYDAVVQSFVIV